MIRLRRSDKIMIIIFLALLHIICLWSVDISVSALLSGGIVTNGFRVADPMISYHIGLYGAILSMFGILSFLIHEMFRKEEEKK